MTMKPLTAKQAYDVYSVLVEECGAAEHSRNYFMSLQCLEFLREYRFGGELGFGGKFRRDHNGCRVDCYPEDSTPERAQMIERANARLSELFGGSVTESEIDDVLDAMR